MINNMQMKSDEKLYFCIVFVNTIEIWKKMYHLNAFDQNVSFYRNQTDKKKKMLGREEITCYKRFFLLPLLFRKTVRLRQTMLIKITNVIVCTI